MTFPAASFHQTRASTWTRTLRQSRRCISSTSSRRADFTHAIIGGGAVGLSIARRLAHKSNTSTLLLEKHPDVGTETSSRNSEVIHAGLYYGSSSLKTQLCVQGKELLYALCARHHIPHAKCGKWIVAQNDVEHNALESIHVLARELGVPTRFVPAAEMAVSEPDVRATTVLESSSTGILDSHAYMQFLRSDFQDRGGDIALRSQVTGIERRGRAWRIQFSSPGGEQSSVSADVLINSAGLYACEINNMILPAERHRTPFYAKGSYFTYNSRTPSTRRLIYPAPVAGHGGLGTHLTLDMSGNIRFGPDVEWVDSPTDLAPTDDANRLEAAIREIRRFLPGVRTEALTLGYAGIRPKLGKFGAAIVTGDAGRESSFQDFYIALEHGVPGFVNLLAIESPGLTSSLAIGEYVYRLIYH